MKINEKLIPIILGISAAIIIGVLAFLSLETSYGYWLIFSFGATTFSVLVFYKADMAQPKNVFFGHLVSIIVGILFNEIFGMSFITLGLAVGLALTLMVYFKVEHPPAAANPLIALLSDVSFEFIFMPVASGTIVIIILSIIVNKYLLKRNYPTKLY
tara:strand:- start:274 stop:744 length:471 start_codon:yes stop_codon:yes gene_type:complete